MKRKEAEATIGKKLPTKHVFKSAETFVAYHQAEKFLEGQGYSVGRMCGHMPVGAKKGNYDIQKWRNLSADDINQLDALMVAQSHRNGPVTVYL
jgi:hypothetical protein